MAEKKAGGSSPIGGAIWILIPLTVIVFFFIQTYFASTSTDSLPEYSTPTSPTALSDFAEGRSTFLEVAERVWNIVVPISVFFSLLFAAVIVYSRARIHQIRAKESEIYDAVVHPVAHNEPSKAQLRWSRILEQANSEREQDWKLAILDADIMLDELLDVQGYRGETMGDKMKQIERSDFNTIDLAWEAHKVRNRIAHEGSSHILNQREARRVVGLYEQVFKEFHYID